MKKILYFLLIVFLAFIVFFKPISIYFLEKSLTRSIKREVKITSLELYPLNLDATIIMPNYPKGIDVHAKYAGGLSLAPRSIGKFIITSTSLGGLVTIEYEHHIYNIDVDSVAFKNVAQILEDRTHIVLEGVINGKIIYYKKKREGTTNLKVTEVVLSLPDIDQTIRSVNDAVHFNVVNLFSRHMSTQQKNEPLTDVDHFQFDIAYKDNKITVKDVALRTDSYRVSLVSKLDKKGDIDYFYIHLLDEQGCVVVTQELQENVKEPKRKTSTAVKNVVQASPQSFFNMGKQMMHYGSSYAGEQTGMRAQTDKMTSYMLNQSENMLEQTTKMVLKKKCKVIYDGKVKHPKKKTITPLENNHQDSSDSHDTSHYQNEQKDLETAPTLYRQKLLL